MARATREEWARRVGRWKASGLSASAFAAREGLNAGTLSWWSSQLRAEVRPRPAFVDVTSVVAASAYPSDEPRSTIAAAGATGAGREAPTWAKRVDQVTAGSDGSVWLRLRRGLELAGGDASEDVVREGVADVILGDGRRPAGGGEVVDLRFRPPGQEAEEVAEIGERLDAVELAARDERDE